MASAAMIRGLRALDAAPDKVLRGYDLYQALAVTNRGRYLIVHRMLRDRLIVEASVNSSEPFFTITFKGMTSLKETQ